MNNHHWKGIAPDPDKNHGFIYLVRNTVTEQLYVGKKAYWSERSKIVPGKTRRKKFKTPNKWEFYTGSSRWLNEAFEEHGKANFEFVMIINCETKGWLTYVECNLQHKLNVLTDKLSDNVTPRFYNKQIGAIKFIPPSDRSYMIGDDHWTNQVNNIQLKEEREYE